MIRYAIIGCGRIAQRHAEQIAAIGKLVAVCDIIPGKADALAKKYACIAFYSTEEIISALPDVDVIAVCTPNGLHAAHSIQSMEAGYHVICEKPMAINSGDCKKMIQVSQQTGKHLLPVKQNRFNPPVLAVKQLIDEDRLGKIFSVQVNGFWNRENDYYKNSWHGTTDLDGGTLFTQFSHFIDLLYWFVGEVKEVSGFTKNYHHADVMNFEDTGCVALQFQNGATGTLNYTVNTFQKNMEGSITLFGENGTVKIGGEYLNELEYQQIKNFTIPLLTGGNPANQYGTYTGSMSNHDKLYENVHAVLQNKANASTSAWEAMKTVEIIEKIYQSVKKL